MNQLDEALFGRFAIKKIHIDMLTSDRLDKRLARVRKVAIDNK